MADDCKVQAKKRVSVSKGIVSDDSLCKCPRRVTNTKEVHYNILLFLKDNK